MRFLLLAAAAIVLTVESPVVHAADQTPLKALPAIDAAAVLGHVKTLASDEFEGRAPGTAGEKMTVAYLVEALQGAGPEAGQPRRHLRPEGAARRHHADGPRRCRHRRRERQGVQAAGATTSSPGPSASPTRSPSTRLRARLRRLRRPGAGVSVGRLQGRSTSRARRWSCWSTIRRCRDPAIAARRSTRRRSAAGR